MKGRWLVLEGAALSRTCVDFDERLARCGDGARSALGGSWA